MQPSSVSAVTSGLEQTVIVCSHTHIVYVHVASAKYL